MTSIEIFLRVGMDPDAREVATLHRRGHEAMAWPAGAMRSLPAGSRHSLQHQKRRASEHIVLQNRAW